MRINTAEYTVGYIIFSLGLDKPPQTLKGALDCMVTML